MLFFLYYDVNILVFLLIVDLDKIDIWVLIWFVDFNFNKNCNKNFLGWLNNNFFVYLGFNGIIINDFKMYCYFGFIFKIDVRWLCYINYIKYKKFYFEFGFVRVLWNNVF